jgi:pectate lyase
VVRAPTPARRWHALAGVATLLAFALALITGTASAATLFSDDFQDGNATGWSRSGGSWSVTGDDSLVYRQSSTSSDAKTWAGGSTWSDYSAQARVKATAFGGSDRYVALAARVQNATNYYYLALRSSGRVELGKRVGGAHTALASASFSIATGTWYTLNLSGGALQGAVNGTPLVSASDTTFRTGMVALST